MQIWSEGCIIKSKLIDQLKLMLQDTSSIMEMNPLKTLVSQGQKEWSDVESLKKTDIPEGFTMNVLLKYLTEYGITINGEEIIDDAERPADKGRRLHMANFIKRAWFVKTDTKLLLACNVKQSMGKIMR